MDETAPPFAACPPAPRNTAITQLEVGAQKVVAVVRLADAPALAGARSGARRERIRAAAIGVVAQGTPDALAQPLLQHALQAVPHAHTYRRSREIEIGSEGAVCGSLRNIRTGTVKTSRGQARQSPT